MITSTRYLEIAGQSFMVNSAGQVLDPCSRCGTENGQISCYRHVQGGVCFKCGGYGGAWVSVEEMTITATRRAKDRARREAKRVADLAKKDRAVAELAEQYPAVARIRDYEAAAEIGGIAVDLRDKLIQYGELSDKQIALVTKIVTEHDTRAERLAAKKAADKLAERPAPTGRVEVTGEIVYTDARQDDYSPYGGMKFVMIVKSDEGFKVWSTIPAALFDGGADLNSLKGARVRYTVTVTPKDGDPAFAFGKRPSKASLLDA